MPKHMTTLTVNGYEVIATFAETRNPVVTGYLKRILLSSFASNEAVSGDILAAVSKRRYNQDGDHHCAP